jgi:hypothetical protein
MRLYRNDTYNLLDIRGDPFASYIITTIGTVPFGTIDSKTEFHCITKHTRVESQLSRLEFLKLKL